MTASAFKNFTELQNKSLQSPSQPKSAKSDDYAHICRTFQGYFVPDIYIANKLLDRKDVKPSHVRSYTKYVERVRRRKLVGVAIVVI